MGHAPKLVRVLSDGRPGHENQSFGLAEAIARRCGSEIELVRFSKGDRLWHRYGKAVAGPSPANLLIGTGHKTHLALFLAARKLDAKSVVIMSPSWPLWFFDLCLAPQHDLGHRRLEHPRVIATFGALNRVPEARAEKLLRGVILIGGPSKAHGWSPEDLSAAIGKVVQARPELNWTISNSRRTPPDFLDGLRRILPQADIHSHEQTQPDWLPKQLSTATDTWATEDSVSMIFEAVTAQSCTGVLPMPVRRPSAAPVQAVRELIQRGYATDFVTWLHNGQRLPAPLPLHETGRCADVVLQRLFGSSA